MSNKRPSVSGFVRTVMATCEKPARRTIPYSFLPISGVRHAQLAAATRARQSDASGSQASVAFNYMRDAARLERSPELFKGTRRIANVDDRIARGDAIDGVICQRQSFGCQ